jgi:cellulose 1,4-beta-cellobiosidase
MKMALAVVLVALLGVVYAQNPFLGKTFYVNPSYQAELNSSISSATGVTKTNLQTMYTVPSAYWLDVMAKVNGSITNTTSAQGILADAKSKGNQLVVLIVYDLPNRDCHAKSSNGEICCTYNSDKTCNYDAGGDCSAGIQQYKTGYIDPLRAVIAQFPTVPVVCIIEPDSLPNLATNTADPHCGNSATKAAYEQGIPYAVNTLSTLSNVKMYIDAAHSGWLGWPNNMQAFSQEIANLGIASKLRGYATNVANYQTVGTMCNTTDSNYCLNAGRGQPCCADPCNEETNYNPCNNEMNYIRNMNASLTQYTKVAPFFITDTGRNGVANMRQDCANWCNIRGAGVGQMPTTNTGNSLVDAFYWLKTPGESDGCTQQLPDGTNCARYDSFCGSSDSIGSQSGEPRAPVAGQWFDYEVKQLATNAHFNGETAWL